MKKTHFLILLFIGLFAEAQVPIRDEAIVAQHKRMVYSRWGDWRPYPKYILWGTIQVNVSYALIWGSWAPSRNRRYKRGADIRPLKATGLETQRNIKTYLQEKEAERIKKSVEDIAKSNKKDFAHWTPLTVDADPLWLLYYKRMLRPLKEFPANPRNSIDWGFSNPEIYSNILKNGGIEPLKEKLEILKDKYKTARTVSMPRGKRFLLYHETLLEWRKFLSSIKRYNKSSFLNIHYTKRVNSIKSNNKNFNFKNDEEIFKNILTQYNY